MKQLVKTNTFGFNVKRREEFSCTLRTAHQDEAKGQAWFSVASLRWGPRRMPGRPARGRRCSEVVWTRRDGLRVSDLQPPFLYLVNVSVYVL